MDRDDTPLSERSTDWLETLLVRSAASTGPVTLLCARGVATKGMARPESTGDMKRPSGNPPPAEITPPKRSRGRPRGSRSSVQQMDKKSAVCVRLGLRGKFFSYRDIAAALTQRSGHRVTVGTVHRLANGIEPTRNATRAAVGLPLVVDVVACTCGQVHVAEVCSATPPTEDVHTVTIWARRVRSGAVVLARSRRCARRRCGVHFVPVTPSQRYCSAECARRTKLVRSRR